MTFDEWRLWIANETRHWIKSKFKWGVTDCASIVRQAAKARYGEDPWPIPTPSSLRTAQSIARSYPPRKMLTDIGATELGANFALTGDIALKDGDLPALGLVILPFLLTADHKSKAVELERWTERDGWTVFRLPEVVNG